LSAAIGPDFRCYTLRVGDEVRIGAYASINRSCKMGEQVKRF